jgi:chemotaxis protein MotB
MDYEMVDFISGRHMMRKALLQLSMLVLGLAMVGGCADKQKSEIDRLTMANQDLAGQVQQLKDELDQKQADLTNCQDKLAGLTGSRESLMKQLDAARNRPVQQIVPPGFEVRNGMIMATLPESVLFDSGKAILKKSASSRLNAVISQIRANFPGRDVFIVGNTDTDRIRRSKWDDNLDLSLARSAAVTRYLISHGMGAKQVIAAGVGEYRPVASNKTSVGKAKNRRVEFWILKPNK